MTPEPQPGLSGESGEKTPSELAGQFYIHPNQISTWREHLLKRASDVFGDAAKSPTTAPAVNVKTPRLKTGELTL